MASIIRLRDTQGFNQSYAPNPVVLNQGQFCPPRIDDNVWRYFWLTQLGGWEGGRRCYWRLVGRGQGCY